MLPNLIGYFSIENYRCLMPAIYMESGTGLSLGNEVYSGDFDGR